MADNGSKIIEVINHYQDALNRYIAKNEQHKMLNCIQKLHRLPVTVPHLQETGVGRTVNSLRKVGGDVGEAARELVHKWRGMVDDDSPDDNDKNTSNENGDNSSHNDSGNNDDSYSSSSDTKTSKRKDKDKERHRNDSRDRKSHKDDENGESSQKRKHSDSSKEHRSKKVKHNESEDEIREENSNNETGSESECESQRNVSKVEYSSSKSKREKEKSGRKSHESSRNSENSSRDRESTSKQKDRERDKSSKGEKLREKDKSKENGHHSRREKDKSDHKEKSSEKNREKSRESHREKDKDKNGEKDKERSREKQQKDVSKDKEKESSRDRHKEKHYKDKEVKEVKEKDQKEKQRSNNKDSSEKYTKDSSEKYTEKSSEKYTEKSSEKSSKTNSGSAEKKSSKKDKSISNNSPVKEKSTVAKKRIDSIDSGSGASFAEALGMLEPTTSKGSKKKVSLEKVNGKARKVEKSPEKIKCFRESPVMLGESEEEEEQEVEKQPYLPEIVTPNIPPLLSKVNKLEPLDINLSSLLPSLTPNYRPLANPLFDNPRARAAHEYDTLSTVISSKNARTKVYSGNKVAYGKVPTLFDFCTRVLMDNIDALEYTGGVPYMILKPILDKCTPDQLFILEHFNPYLIEDTDSLWQFHCLKEFRNKKREELESWREMYTRCLDEREAKLKALTANIKQSQDKSLPVRQTKLAYVDSVVKPPRGVVRKQVKHGYVDDKSPLITPASRLAGNTGISVPNPGARAASSSGSNAIIKIKKAPLMQKTLALMKGRFRR